MKRRAFIRNLGLAAAVSQAFPTYPFNTFPEVENRFALLNSFL